MLEGEREVADSCSGWLCESGRDRRGKSLETGGSGQP